MLRRVTDRLSLKREFGGCERGFSGYDGLGRLGGFDVLGGFGRFSRFDRFSEFCGFDGFGGFSGFDGEPRVSLNGFPVSFTPLLKVLYLLVSYPPSYTWLKGESRISRKERFIPRYLQYRVLGDCLF